jgi:PAS domain S-box-containing protein
MNLGSTHDQLDQRVAELTAEFSRLDLMVKDEMAERERAEEQVRCQSVLLDMAQDAVLICDLEARITFWSQGARRIYGWAAETAQGKLLSELLYPLDASDASPKLAKIIEKMEYRAEENHVHQSGRSIAVETRWALLRNAEGKPSKILLVITDITEQKEVERQFLRMQRLETVGLLASGIAHDLNNVLAPILMAAQNLLSEIKDETQIDLLRSIEASARRGGALVHQVLSFARGAEGERVPVQIQQLLHEFQKVAKDTFPRSIQIVTRFEKNVRPVLGNKTQLYQAIMNLCVNARDAMPNGGILQLEANNVVLDDAFVGHYPPAQPGEYLMFKISDNGVGIADEVLDKIFDPFFTTKESGKGTGLGLSTVLGIVKRHGGFLEVQSKLGKGSKFTVYLPTVESTTSVGSAIAAPFLPNGNGKVVLLVDDERPMRDITASTLKKNGYQVLTASDGTEGFALFTQHRSEIAVVVTDMSMPYMDGGKMIRALYQIDPKARIIAMSGLNEDVNLPDTMKKRIPFLKKPFALEKLLEALHEVTESAPTRESGPHPKARRKPDSSPAESD